MRYAVTAFLVLVLAACGGDNTASNVNAPGRRAGMETKVLGAGASLLQDKPPIEALNSYLDGFHFRNGDQQFQVEAHHYCATLGEEITQCVIYDGNVKDAKLIGVEYVISARLFATLPEIEKPLWHSHVYEVKSGQLVAPGIPALAEHALMKKMVTTYGKTWHTWHTDRQQELPLGVPQLMMGFTADGQLDPHRLAERDNRFGISTDETRRRRGDIETPAIAPGADAWQQGRVVQLTAP
ncbi:MAG: OBAP family protein [Gammaproteobacteria bacterium]|nr:OBAP family protein [Gammaproteobacteria bacterium]MBI5616507.1 OBAP family protein [Gammaproteobacteria bacterium]